jgi:hypothetical protein
MASSSISSFIVRHQFLARAIGVAGVTVVLLLAGVIPLVNVISRNAQKIETRDRERQALADKVSILSQLDQNVLQERLRVLDSALPPRKDVVAYLASIDGLSRELGLSFGGLSITPGEVTDRPDTAKKTTAKRVTNGLQVLDTTIKVKGSESSIYAFLRSVEQALPLMQIEDAKVSGLSAGQFTLSLSLGMLWAPAAPADVKGAVALFNEKEEGYFQTLATYKSYKADLNDAVIDAVPGGKADLFSP